jgi:hypothetical protein
MNTLAYYLIDRHKLTTAVLEAEAPSATGSEVKARLG